MLVTDGGQLIRCPVEGIRIVGRGSQGVIVFNTAETEKVVSVERIGEVENGEGESGEGESDGLPKGRTETSELAETPAKFDPLDPAMAERRAAARKRLDAIDPAKQPGGGRRSATGATGSRRFMRLPRAIPPTCPGAIWSPIRCWPIGWRETRVSTV